MGFCGLPNIFRRRRSSKQGKSTKNPSPRVKPSFGTNIREKSSCPPSYHSISPSSLTFPPTYTPPPSDDDTPEQAFCYLSGTTLVRITPHDYRNLLMAAENGSINEDVPGGVRILRHYERALPEKLQRSFELQGSHPVPRKEFKSVTTNGTLLLTESEVQEAKRNELMRKLQESRKRWKVVAWDEFMEGLEEVTRAIENGEKPKKPKHPVVWTIVVQRDLMKDPALTKQTAPSVKDIEI